MQGNYVDQYKELIGVVNHNVIGSKYELADPSSGNAYELSGQVIYENTLITSIDKCG